MSVRASLLLFGISGLFLVAFFVVPGLVDGKGAIPASVGPAVFLGLGVIVFAGLGVASFIVGPLVRLRSITVSLLIVGVGVAFFNDIPSTAICRVSLGASFDEYRLVCSEDLAIAGIVMVVLGGFVFFKVLGVLKEERRRREEMPGA